jgi:hypothetical protein
MQHILKTNSDIFQKIVEGKKKFELRLGVRDIKEGDFLILEEWDIKNERYTGRKLEKKVKFVLKTKEIQFWPQKDVNKYGFTIASFD